MSRTLSLIIALLVILTAMVFCDGCTGKQIHEHLIDQGFTQTGTALDKAAAHNDSAEAANQKLKPFVAPAGQQLVGVVTTEHKSVTANLDDGKRALTELHDAVDRLTVENTLLKADNKKLNDSYFSPKQKGQFRTLLAYAILIFGLMAAVKVFSGLDLAPGFVGIVGKIAKCIYTAIVWLGTGFIVPIIVKLHAGMQKIAADLHTAKTVATATAHANSTGNVVRMPVSATAHVTAVPQVVIASVPGSASQPISPTQIPQ